MRLPFKELDKHVDRTIYKRGLSYFQEGAIIDCKEAKKGQFHFTILGSSIYSVDISVDDDVVTAFECDCPYDWGPICKHVVAAILHLQEHERPLGEDPDSDGEKKSKGEQVIEIIDRLSLDQFKVFLKDIVFEYDGICDLLLARFSPIEIKNTKMNYRKKLKRIIAAQEEEFGYIPLAGARLIGNAVAGLLEKANEALEEGSYRDAFYVSIAILEEMTAALEMADDSNSDIGSSIEGALQLLDRLIDSDVTDNLRKEVLDYCIQAYEASTFKGWDWHMGMLHRAFNLISTAEEAQHLSNLLDKVNDSIYSKQEAQALKYRLLRATKGEKVANDYLEQHSTNPELRRMALQRAISQRDFVKGYKLAYDGIAHDIKERPGLGNEWYDWNLKVALAEGNTDKIIDFARYLFVIDYVHGQDYYQVLKDHVPAEAWESMVNDIVAEVLEDSRRPNIPLLCRLFVKEKSWDRLLEQVKRHPTLSMIQAYEEYLEDDYSRDLVDLYAAIIEEEMMYSKSRKHYKAVCRLLRRMISLGGQLKVKATIAYLRQTYPRRSALMDELDKV